MLVIGIDTQGNPVQFEANAEPIEMDVALVAHGAATALGASSGKVTVFRVDAGGASAKGGVAVSGAATLNKASGQITTEALTTAAAAEYTLTITNSMVSATDLVMASVQNGTNTTGAPVLRTVTPSAGSLAIVVRNDHASAALNGTLKISFVIFKI